VFKLLTAIQACGMNNLNYTVNIKLYLRGDVRVITYFATNRHVRILQRHHYVQHVY